MKTPYGGKRRQHFQEGQGGNEIMEDHVVVMVTKETATESFQIVVTASRRETALVMVSPETVPEGLTSGLTHRDLPHAVPD